MKPLLPLLLLLALPFEAEAGPHPVSWIKHHPVALKLIAAGASGAAELYGVNHCQSGDIERCLGHYGYGKTIAAFSIGLNFAMIPVSEKLGGWQGDVLSYGWSSANLATGIYNWRNFKSEDAVLQSPTIR